MLFEGKGKLWTPVIENVQTKVFPTRSARHTTRCILSILLIQGVWGSKDREKWENRKKLASNLFMMSHSEYNEKVTA